MDPARKFELGNFEPRTQRLPRSTGRLMDLVTQSKALALACDPQIGADLHQLVVWLRDDEPSQVTFESSSTKLTPASLGTLPP